MGSVLDEPLDRVWERALAWREDPFVVAQVTSIVTPKDWARVARTLDERYGSPADLHRIKLRREA